MCACLWAGLVRAAHYLMWEASALIRPPAHVVLVGLDSSGKTTALLRLRYGQYVNAVPTVGFNTEKVRAGGAHWVAWDVGGAERVRPLWRSYTRATDALVFVVDSGSPEERLEEARVELQRLARLHRATGTPLLVLANKQDLPGARDPQHLAKAMGLPEMPNWQPWAVAPACAVTGEGLDEAMATLNTMVHKARQTKQASRR